MPMSGLKIILRDLTSYFLDFVMASFPYAVQSVNLYNWLSYSYVGNNDGN